ncbi:MAG: hypothetical protein ACOCV4_04460 [Myxococcota bacterium]
MLQRHRNAVIALLVVAGIALGTWLAVGQRAPTPTEPLGYVPGEAVAVGYLRVSPVMASPFVKAFFPQGDAMARLERLCGFDPLEGLDEMMVVVDEKDIEQVGPLGLVARGRLDRERLAGCLERLIERDGGSTRQTELDGVPAMASGDGRSRAAFVDDRTVAIGSEDAVRGVLEATRGEAPSAASNPVLGDLWDRVGGGRDGVVVAELPERWQPVASAFAERHLGTPLEGVQAVGLGLDVQHGLELGGLVRTANAGAAARAVEALQARVKRLRREPLVGATVLGTALRRLKLAAQGPEIVVTLKLDDSHVEALASLLRRNRRPRAPADAPEEPSKPPKPDVSLERPSDSAGEEGNGGAADPASGESSR